MTGRFFAEQRIDRPREAVWRFMTDARRASAWMRGVDAIETTVRRPRPGSRYRQRAAGGAGPGGPDLVVTAYDPPRRFQAVLATTGGRLVYEYRLRPLGGRATRVVFEVRAEATTVRGRLYMARSLRAIRARDADVLARLRDAVEDQVPPPDWRSPVPGMRSLIDRSRHAARIGAWRPRGALRAPS